MNNTKSSQNFPENFYDLFHLLHGVVMYKGDANDTVTDVEFRGQVVNKGISVKVAIANSNL